MSLALFLARRFYKSAHTDHQRRATALAIRIATIGVTVGLAVMIISVGVVKGFQREIKSTVTGFASHIEVLPPASFSSPESHPMQAVPAFIQNIKHLPEVVHVQRVSQKMGILKTEDAYQTILLKGIGPEYDTHFLSQHLIAGKIPHFSPDSASNQILISARQARTLHLKVGSKVYTYFVNDDIRLRRFTIAGIYETNLSQFDEHFVWTDINTVNKLNDWGADTCSNLEVNLKDFDAIPSTQAAITRLIAARANNETAQASPVAMAVYENPHTSAILQWIDLLDLNVWVILGLMAGVAGFTMISGILILILERTRTIGILKALGASNTRIRHTFILYASFIALRGMIWGNVVGVGLLLIQHHFTPITLDPTTYYVSSVPVSLSPLLILLINISTLILILIALILPSFLISRIQPAQSIKYE